MPSPLHAKIHCIGKLNSPRAPFCTTWKRPRKTSPPMESPCDREPTDWVPQRMVEVKSSGPAETSALDVAAEHSGPFRWSQPMI